jgi:uncharacterized protein
MPIARTLWNRRIKARDDIELAADVCVPPGSGPFPTVVLRTPYMRGRVLSNPRGWIRLVEHGYAFVVIDVRGRGDSDGEWMPWCEDSSDGHDVIEWVAHQPWCDGQIGMVGGSYEGLTQWWTAAGSPEHLKCIAPFCVGAMRSHRPFGTGIPMQYWLWWLSLVMGRTRQYPGAPAWEASLMHTPLRSLDERVGVSRSAWRRYVNGEIDYFSGLGAEEYAAIDIPVLLGVGWWDDQETMLVWQALQRAKSAKDCRLLIGAWDHAGTIVPRPVLGGVDVSASVIDTIGYVEQFLALHLKGERTAIADTPRCRVFLTGENRWDSLEQWPHPGAQDLTFYLSSDGDARGLRGHGCLVADVSASSGSDTFIYDPNHPGRDMSNLNQFAWADPPLDHRYLQRRGDVLVYTSDILQEPLLVSGRYRLCVFVSSDRPDTDLYVHLCDVHPDGRALGLAATNEPPAGLRLRYRNGPVPELLQPGATYEVTIEGTWLHHVFSAGHRVRLSVSSGNFPFSARNAGSGLQWAEDVVLHPQTNTIHHSPAHPSRIVLPVVAGGAR